MLNGLTTNPQQEFIGGSETVSASRSIWKTSLSHAEAGKDGGEDVGGGDGAGDGGEVVDGLTYVLGYEIRRDWIWGGRGTGWRGGEIGG